MNAVEREQNRQTWLAAFGLTPWVAREHFPGAAPSELLPLPQASQPNQPAANTPANDGAAAARAALGAQKTPVSVAPAPQTTPAEAPQAQTKTTEKAQQAALPRPVVYLVGDTLVVAEQQDPQAPEPSRDEQRLLQSLSRLFGDSRKHYPFVCPLDSSAAQDMLTTFCASLAQQGLKRLLLCLRDSSQAFLFGNSERYQTFRVAELPALAISSLNDMLTEPLAHKKRSWQAIREAGFDQPTA